MAATLGLLATAEVGAQTIQTLISFNGTNGVNPQAGLALGNDGSFYGTTSQGGSAGWGTVFKVTTNGTLSTLISFSNAVEGNPNAALTLGNDGDFYGTTTYSGGTFGTVFKVTTNGTLTTLASFDYTFGYGPSALTMGNDGNFYGTISGQDSGGFGTVFKVTANGTLTLLASFNPPVNGYQPEGGLTLGNDGNLYGTTANGGRYGSFGGYGESATVFKLTTNGTLTSLVSFSGTNGANSQAALTLGDDGNFYGTTQSGGSVGYGTVFKLTTNGTLTALVSFNNSNGAYPNALTMGSDGNFYGTTFRGGVSGYGTVFIVTTNGTLITLISFNNTNGTNPRAPLTLGRDGNFYGTTSRGGITNSTFQLGMGTLFRVLLPPVIIVRPQSQTNNAGATVTFLVSATTLHPMSFQWQKNGTNLVDGDSLSGTTTNTLTITGISASDAASYSVIVSNSNGSVTNFAALTVITPPSITAQPPNLLVLPGTNVAFGVSLTGTVPFRYQWQFNGTNILNATNAIYAIPAVGTNNAGNYVVVITNAAGSATSSNAALTVVLSPKSQTNYASSTATFTATAFSPESVNYQWQKNGTNLVNGGNLSGVTNSTLTIASVSDADAAIYNAVVSDAYSSVTTSNAVLTVNNFPFIVSQPQSQIVLAGSNVTFNATAYGAPPLIFQWYFKGTPVGSPDTGTNVSSYTLTNVGTNQAGNYSVQAVNGYGSVTSSIAVLTVVASPPTITTQPANRTNNAATTATFSVVASSLGPINYQWQKDGTNLVNGGKFSGATTNTLTITSVSSNEAAIYSVTVTNLAGRVTSSNATLTVIDPPAITAQPSSQRLLLGSGVSFNVTVSGTAPFRYQWRFNNANILNATNAAYAIQAVVATNTGNYSVVVTNSAGSVTSSNALLTVIVPPTLALQFSAGYPLLKLYGMLNSNFVVQYNASLADTNWIKLLSLTNLSASPYQFLDPAGGDQPARFYRAFMQ